MQNDESSDGESPKKIDEESQISKKLKAENETENTPQMLKLRYDENPDINKYQKKTTGFMAQLASKTAKEIRRQSVPKEEPMFTAASDPFENRFKKWSNQLPGFEKTTPNKDTEKKFNKDPKFPRSPPSQTQAFWTLPNTNSTAPKNDFNKPSNEQNFNSQSQDKRTPFNTESSHSSSNSSRYHSSEARHYSDDKRGSDRSRYESSRYDSSSHDPFDKRGSDRSRYDSSYGSERPRYDSSYDKKTSDRSRYDSSYDYKKDSHPPWTKKTNSTLQAGIDDLGLDQYGQIPSNSQPPAESRPEITKKSRATFVYTAPDTLASEEQRRQEFRSESAKWISSRLNKFYKKNVITSKEDYKYLCRKLTHRVVDNEDQKGSIFWSF